MPQHNLTREEARLRAATVAVDAYAVELRLGDDDRDFTSRTTVTFTAEPGAETFIDAIAEEIHEVVLNGTSLPLDEVVTPGRIRLPGLAERNDLVVSGRFQYSRTGEGLHRFVDPVDREVYLYSQFEVADARRVFAVFDQPDLKASFAFSVTAPKDWTVVSNSPTPAPQAAGDAAAELAVWHFAPTPRISSYITAIVAGPYHSAHSSLTSSNGDRIPLGVYARASLFEHVDAQEIFAITQAGFEFFEDAFDHPYPFEKYDQLFVPEFNAGAMENAGCVTFVEDYVFRSRPTEAVVERRTVTILHELAHMWFGDLVTMRWWDDLWLNESFAEFASTLAAAEATRWTGAWATFASMEKSWAYKQDQLPSTHPVVADIRDLQDVEVNFDGITYAKGASVLRQLVAWVGLENFLAGVRRYFARHAWGNTELRDLLAELEAASGRDLGDWPARWLQTAGVNTLRLDYTVDEAGRIRNARVLQSAPESHPTLRQHRIGIGCYVEDDGALVLSHRTELDIDGAQTPVPGLEGVPAAALVLLNDGDLAYAKIRLDPESLRACEDGLDRLHDPLAQALVRGALWDMARDAELPASRFLDLALAGLPSIPDSTGLLVQIRQLVLVAEEYTAPHRRPQVLAGIGDRLITLAEAAPAGSDHQLQYVRALARLACTPEHAGWLDRLRSGELVLEGFTVDADVRWDLIAGLAATSALREETLAGALAEDNTAAGQRHHLTATAADPSPGTKRQVMDDLLHGNRGNAESAALIAGFRRSGQAARSELAARYFNDIRGAWEARAGEIAQQLARGLFPPATPEALDMARRWLDGNADAPAGLLRIMRENVDEAERALRAQSADRPDGS
ncbi:aminopeptidase N [Sediminivirga luteola]|uniref:aminopeptidase N n=1 Tax=Sediminivirga luteola TaxID=1774748 RepID=UPI001F5A087E|nr:aminopeptidase N [Sediminivirga luteola]